MTCTTKEEIEERMADVMLIPNNRYEKAVAEYNRLLAIMGDVDDSEIIALALVAAANILNKEQC